MTDTPVRNTSQLRHTSCVAFRDRQTIGEHPDWRRARTEATDSPDEATLKIGPAHIHRVEWSSTALSENCSNTRNYPQSEEKRGHLMREPRTAS